MPPVPVSTTAAEPSPVAISSASSAAQSSASSALALPCCSRSTTTCPSCVRSIIGSSLFETVGGAQLRQPAALPELLEAAVEAGEEGGAIVDVAALLRHRQQIVAALDLVRQHGDLVAGGHLPREVAAGAGE